MLKKILLLGLWFFTFSISGMEFISKLKNPLTIEERIRNAINEGDYRTVVNLVTPETKPENILHYTAIAKGRIRKTKKRALSWYITTPLKVIASSSILYSMYDHFRTQFGCSKKTVYGHFSVPQNIIKDITTLSSSFLVCLLLKEFIFPKHNEQLLIYLYLEHLISDN